MIPIARPTATYAWVIDTDHISFRTHCSEVGTTGPSDAPLDMLEMLHADTESGHRFRVLDDVRA